jgi:hypothetical protein
MFGINNYRKIKKIAVEIEMRNHKDAVLNEIEALRTKKFEVRNELQEYKIKAQDEIAALARRCAEEKGRYEHEYHSTKEKLGIELAELEAKIKMIKNDAVVYERLLKEKDKEIERLNNICFELMRTIKFTVNVQK